MDNTQDQGQFTRATLLASGDLLDHSGATHLETMTTEALNEIEQNLDALAEELNECGIVVFDFDHCSCSIRMPSGTEFTIAGVSACGCSNGKLIVTQLTYGYDDDDDDDAEMW